MSAAAGTRALWYVGAGQAEVRDERLEPLAAGAVRVRARHGAVSRGTESLVAHGRVPPSEFERMRAPFMAGPLPFPGKYRLAPGGVVQSGAPPFPARAAFRLPPPQTRVAPPIAPAGSPAAPLPRARAVL